MVDGWLRCDTERCIKELSDMLRVPVAKPKPDVETFVKVLRGEVVPERPPLAELYFDPDVIREVVSKLLGREWVDPGGSRDSQEAYLTNFVEFWYRLGYDYVRLKWPCGLSLPENLITSEDTASLAQGTRSWAGSSTGHIRSWEDFGRYPWPDPAVADLWQFEFIANNLPEGMGLMACPGLGFFESPAWQVFGYENLCLLIHDEPELVEAVFDRFGSIVYELYRKMVGLPKLCGFFHSDDLGFRSGTLVSPAFLRETILPWHRKVAQLAHENDLLFLLHSCGNIEEIADDLIDDVRIDGRHSFEDGCNPITEFKRRYGGRTAVLGGIDMDKLCRCEEQELRRHVREVISTCIDGGRFALGSGNTIANYVPIGSFLAMIDECFRYRG